MTTNKSLPVFIALALMLPAGCSKKNGAAPQSANVAPERSAQNTQEITGPVLETMDAGSYTYVRVGSASGDVWAAAQKFDVKVGDRVVVEPETPMQNFHSQTLNRDFPLIYFTTSIRKEGEAAPAQQNPHAGLMPSHGTPSGATAPADPIAQPAGAMTVADIWSQRKSLAGKTVTVKGKVVKFNGQIMGRNWVHIQDGSGKAADGTNDLTLTTNDETKVGEVVTVTGTVAIDKDFTAGYAYPVLLENATIAK